MQSIRMEKSTFPTICGMQIRRHIYAGDNKSTGHEMTNFIENIEEQFYWSWFS